MAKRLFGGCWTPGRGKRGAKKVSKRVKKWSAKVNWAGHTGGQDTPFGIFQGKMPMPARIKVSFNADPILA